MGKNSAIGVLSFSVANRRRDFLLPSVAPSASLVWQRPASWFNSTPRFLAAQRSAVSSLGEEVAQREPLKGFPLDSFGNRGARPLWLPGLPGTDSVTNRACSRTFEYSLVEGYDKLGRPNSAQSKFSLKISLRGAAFAAMRSPVPHCSPPARHFCRAKMPCGGQVFQICCSAVKSSDFLHASRYLHARKRVLPKYVETLDWVGTVNLGLPESQKGRSPFVSERVQRKPF